GNVLRLLPAPRAGGATLRGDRGLPGREMVAAAADCGQAGDQPPWGQPPLRGHESVRPWARHLPRCLRAAWRRARKTNWRNEERLTDGSLIVPSLSCQRAEAAGTHLGVCLGRVASGGDGNDSGNRQGRGKHPAAEVVESRRRRSDERPADLVSLLGDLAVPG